MKRSLRKGINLVIVVSLLLSFTGYVEGRQSSGTTTTPNFTEGAWGAADGTVINVEPRRVVFSSGSTLSVKPP